MTLPPEYKLTSQKGAAGLLPAQSEDQGGSGMICCYQVVMRQKQRMSIFRNF